MTISAMSMPSALFSNNNYDSIIEVILNKMFHGNPWCFNANLLISHTNFSFSLIPYSLSIDMNITDGNILGGDDSKQL